MSKPACRFLRSAPGGRSRAPLSHSRAAVAATLSAAALGAVVLFGTGCGRTGESRTPDAVAAEIASIDARLRGSFRLESFVPAVTLEPMLVSLLEFQYKTLIIRFDGKRIIADSPGVHVDRAYEIREPKGDRFKLVSLDETGVPYESVCEFSGSDQVLVHSQTAPWTGIATLRRAR